LASITSHWGVAVGRLPTFVIRLGSESISMMVTIRSPAYSGWPMISAITSMYSFW
jgi:hypothetical protein